MSPKTGVSDGVSHGVFSEPLGPRAPLCPAISKRIQECKFKLWAMDPRGLLTGRRGGEEIALLGRPKVGYGIVMDGIAKFQALKFTFQGLKFPVKSLVLLVRRRIPQKFQALRFQNSGPEIWRIHPPPFHTPPLACLITPDTNIYIYIIQSN